MCVEKYPDEKDYLELSNDIMKFTFPEPVAMESVKCLTRFVKKYPDKKCYFEPSIDITKFAFLSPVPWRA